MATTWRDAGQEPSLSDIYSDSLFAQILRRDRLCAEEVKTLIRKVQGRLTAKLQRQQTQAALDRVSLVFSLRLAVSNLKDPGLGGWRPSVPLPLAG